jgi:hypothetical protein
VSGLSKDSVENASQIVTLDRSAAAVRSAVGQPFGIGTLHFQL